MSVTSGYVLKIVKTDTIPLFTSAASLTWVLHDYFLTIEDEIRYIWPSRLNLGKLLYFWIRLYTVVVVAFDVAQINTFAKRIPSLATCVAMDPITRVLGAISLWSIEIVMQMRIYALYDRSKKVAIFNGVLFIASMAGFLWLLIINAGRRGGAIRDIKMLDIPGCPSIHTDIEFLQWIPPTAFEAILFLFALYKTCKTVSMRWSNPGLQRVSLYRLVVQDNVLYFLGISCVLIFNNLMVVTVTRIPWFSYGPFHAGMGIMTVRLLLHLHKAVHRLQTMSKPGSTVYMSHHTGPITFRLNSGSGSDEGIMDGEEQDLFRARSGRDAESNVGVAMPQNFISAEHNDIEAVAADAL